ncbi:hypothetical protein ITJ57_11935 [Plantibacter sp. VKM Ac-2880]|uniref:hypothetical protein n=1 Tax=Plantibacter sp. VKM Ac-2880 TaxID=2783827 RepID=UPI00188F3C4E|nr:hypothetical protein [Plantibacter sp. VKM Ac-2880]MBF4569471.1 hypothetical protein [Plantibacter sp. VKM Ac-2880]
MTILAAPPLPSAPTTELSDEHPHTWTTESAHSTSEGRLRYLRCASCGSRRVVLEPYEELGAVVVTRHDIASR